MSSLERLVALVGEEKVDELATKSVIVIGVGGVGGYVTEALARSGIGRIVIVDHDIVDATNLNRQIIALNSTIGKAKVEVLESRIRDINPNINVEALKLFLDDSNIDLLSDVDYVVDACDSMDTKFAIIKYCDNKSIPFISCMGTGNKMDPTRFKIMDIRKTSYDPLAKRIRKFVIDSGIKGKVNVVCSDEERYSDITSPMPSNAFVPAVAGMICASYVINEIVK